MRTIRSIRSIRSKLLLWPALIAAAWGVASCGTVQSMHTDYTVTEHSDTGKVDVSPPVAGIILNAHDALMHQGPNLDEQEDLYLRAAQTYFLQSGRVCKFSDGARTTTGWEFDYRC